MLELPPTILGCTGLEVTRLGIGGAYCETPEGYQRALDCGVNHVDTACLYRDGEGEHVIGKAIAASAARSRGLSRRRWPPTTATPSHQWSAARM